PYSAAGVAITVGAPVAPILPSAAPGNASAKVSWWVPGANGSAITGYVITPYIGSVAQPAQTLASANTTATVIGLTNGTSYPFKVAAINAIGTGPASPLTAAVVIGTPTVPAFQSAVPGNGTAKVTWWPSNANGSAITGYVITPYIGTAAQ